MGAAIPRPRIPEFPHSRIPLAASPRSARRSSRSRVCAAAGDPAGRERLDRDRDRDRDLPELGWECGWHRELMPTPLSPVPPHPLAIPADLPRICWKEAGKAAGFTPGCGAAPRSGSRAELCHSPHSQPRYSQFSPSPATAHLSPACCYHGVAVVTSGSGHSSHGDSDSAEQPQPHGVTAAVPEPRALPRLDIGPGVTTVTPETSIGAGAAGRRGRKGPKFCMRVSWIKLHPKILS